MSVPSEVDVVVAPTSEAETGSYVDWPAIIAGIVIAAGISLVLLTFGSAIGLSMVNFNAGPDVPAIWIAIAAGSWLLWVQISSFMAGGYLTGRMRRRFPDATEHESDVRDGAHGLLVWAGALVIGAIIAVGGIGSALTAVGNAVGTATTAASKVAQGAAANPSAGHPAAVLDPNAYFTDTLFRLPQGAAPPAGTTTTDVRGEAGRILATSATTGVSDADKAYLGQLVAQQTGLPPDQAKARVDETLKAIDAAKAKAADAAEQARKTTVLGAFLTAASLLISAVGAYWAAMKGGRHRDEGTVFADMFGRY